LSAGLEHSSGAAVVPARRRPAGPAGGDPRALRKWLEGNDIVYATRVDRASDSAAKRMTAASSTRIYKQDRGYQIPDNAGDFRLLDRKVVDALCQLPERNRFMKGLFPGSASARPRSRSCGRRAPPGTSKWRYWRLWNFALDGITAFSTMPLRIWSLRRRADLGAAFAYALYLIVRNDPHRADVPGYASLMVAVLFMGGVNLMSLGVLGEYLGRASIPR